MIITHHAQRRAKERLGWSRSTLERMAGKALREGLREEEVEGRLMGYLKNRKRKYPHTEYIFHGEHIFVFDFDRLVTVVRIPTRFNPFRQRSLKSPAPPGDSH